MTMHLFDRANATTACGIKLFKYEPRHERAITIDEDEIDVTENAKFVTCEQCKPADS